jgi:hypothetical protein
MKFLKIKCVLFCRYAAEMAMKDGCPFQSEPSESWWKGIKQRHEELTLRKPEATSSVRHNCMNKGYTKLYFNALEEVLKTITSGVANSDVIWNMDETGLTLLHRPSKCIAS